MHPDAARWNHKYRSHFGPRSFEPEPLLIAHAGVPQGRGLALEIACGTGAGAMWLAARGWRVVALDVSVEGLRVARDEACRRGVRVGWAVADAARVPLAPRGFDLVVVIRFLDRALFPWVRDALAPGGRVVWKTFHRGRLVRHPRFNPDFLLAAGELREAFAGLEEIEVGDDDESSWIVARRPP